MTSWRRLFPLVAAGVLLVTACGGGASPSPSAAPPASVAAAPPLRQARQPSAAPVADICTNPPKADGMTLTFASYGGAYQEAQRKGWLEPYAALTGVTFQESEDSSNATIKAQVEAGQVTWDIVDVGNDFGLDAKPPCSNRSTTRRSPRTRSSPGFAGTYRVADITYGVVLGYNTDKTAGQVPEGWADFFDTDQVPRQARLLGLLGGRHLRVRPAGRRRGPRGPLPARSRAGNREARHDQGRHRVLGFGRRVAGPPRQGRGRHGA